MDLARRRFHAPAVVMLAIFLLCISAVGDTSASSGRPSPIELLRSRIVPDDAPARPPFQLARYDLDQQPAGNAEQLSVMRQRAQLRQMQLYLLWRQLSDDRVEGRSPAELADYHLLAYAFGEAKLHEAVRAAKAAGPVAQFRLAKLFLAECRFEDAVRLLVAVADTPKQPAGDLPRQALALLVRHATERAALEKHIPLLPLSFDLQGWLARHRRDPAARSFIEAVERTTTIRLPVDLAKNSEIYDIGDSEDEPPQEIDVDPTLDMSHHEAWAPPALLGNPWKIAALRDPKRAYLVTGGPEFVLYAPQRQPEGAGRVQLTLASEFNGPIRFHLYRFATRTTWEEVQAATLKREKPVRSWMTTFEPLESNNGDMHEWSVPLNDLREGYYLLTAEARYAPMLAACKFCESSVSVYLRAGRNRAVVLAVDRRTGKPVADLPLKLHVAGKPDAEMICQQAKPTIKDAFLRGFRGEKAGVEYTDGPAVERAKVERDKPNNDDPFGDAPPTKPSRPVPAPAGPDADAADEPGPSHQPGPSLAGDLREAVSFAQGTEVRRRYPDLDRTHELRTGRDGIATLELDLGHREYRYELEVRRMSDELDAGPAAHVAIEYREPEPTPPQPRAVVWAAQPVYRPGQTVEFAGLVRPLADGPVNVRVANRQGTVWEGPCNISSAGTFQGRFCVPLTARMGACRFEVNGTRAEPDGPLTIEDFRVAAFQVRLTVPRRSYTAGERVEGQVEVVYFTGKPAAEAQVEVEFYDSIGRPVNVSGVTGPSGVYRFSFAVPSSESHGSVILRATVMDASGQAYTQYERIERKADAFRVELDSSQRSVSPGTTVELRVTATTWAGKPLAGAIVSATGLRETAVTNAQGKALLPWRVVSKNSETIEVTVVSGGKAVHQSQSVRMRDEPADAEAGGLSSVPSIVGWKVPERAVAGDPLACTITLHGPAERRVPVAVFAEADRLLASRLLWVLPGEHRVEIPTARDWAPHVHLIALVLNERNRESSREACYLHPREKFLTLSIETDKAEYRPGQRCTARIKALDYEGRPVPGAEISLGVVDEAVYQVREDPLPDLFQLLYEVRSKDLCVGELETSSPGARPLQFLLGPRGAWGYYGPVEILGNGHRRTLLCAYGGTKCSTRSRADIRQRFDTAAHWVGRLVTDGDGRATTAFTLPDNVTAWRFTARGVTPDTRVGQVRVTHRTLLPLALEMAVPRGLREGDRIELPVAIVNHAEQAMTVRAMTRVGSSAEQPWSGSELMPGASRRTTIPIMAVGMRPLEVFAAVEQLGGPASDAVRKTITPLRRGRPWVQNWSGPLELDAAVRVDRQAEDGEELVLTIRRDPGLAGIVRPALEELVDYPYGCVEQTMSRFMPAVVAGEAMKQAGLRQAAVERLPEVVARGLAILAGYQHADGGWGWWKDDTTNDFMSAYVVEGLARCARLGQPVDTEMLRRASQPLLERLRDKQLSGHRPASIGEVDLSVYVAHALAVTFAHDPKRYELSLATLRLAIESLTREQSTPTTLDRLLLADTWRLLGDTARARTELETAAVGVVPRAGDRGSIFAAAAVLELGTAMEPSGRRWTPLARQMAAARSGNGWGDTLTTSAAVRGLAALMTLPPTGESPVTVEVDGRAFGTLVAAQGNRLRLALPRVGVVALRPAKLPCEDFYAVSVEGRETRWPAAPTEPAATVRTRVFLSQREMKPDNSGLLTIRRGVTHELRIEVDLRQSVSHARLTLPRPCGMELVRLPPHTGGLVAIEGHDDAIHLFIDRWEAGRHEAVFAIRAEVSGSVAAPPAELSPMYGDSLPTAVIGSRQWMVEQ